jgi:L-aspartate oxidase
VHGANRLASNSLLEGLVFGARAAETMMAEAQVKDGGVMVVPESSDGRVTGEAATERWIAELRELMWKDAGLLRDENGLRRAQRGLAALAVSMPRGLFRRAMEARNLLAVAEMIVNSALGREESRGAHFRNDFPLRDEIGKHSVMRQGRLEFVA